MAYTNEQLGKALEDLTAAYNNFVDKAKEAAIAAMSETVIKQIKQDAKDFIADELKTQRDTLMQAIENAKITLRNSAVEAGNKLEQYASEKKDELSALITAAETALKEKTAVLQSDLEKIKDHAKKEIKEITDSVIREYEKKSKKYTDDLLIKTFDDLLIKIFQKGYIQLPGMPSPLEDTSMHYEGYSWYEVNYDGNFFRAKGRNAKAFSAKKLTKEQIKNGNYIFQDDEQGDAIKDITGSVLFNAAEVGKMFSGVFSGSQEGSGYLWDYRTYVESPLQRLSFKASSVVPTAEENRSRNLTFTFWVLVKNE